MFLVTRQEKFHFPIENFSNLICIKLASLQNLEQDIFPFWIYTAGCNTDIYTGKIFMQFAIPLQTFILHFKT